VVPLDDLPRLDERAVVVAAAPDAAWHAALRTFRSAFAAPAARAAARLLGCQPAGISGWDRPVPGSTVPGFRVVTAEPPTLLVVAGRHRFSRYGIAVRISPAERGSRVSVESRATFPGPHGALYRLAVVGSGVHVLAVRRLLRQVAREAARRTTAP
jgi:hypothetical protein